jgi:hypothetical protein
MRIIKLVSIVLISALVFVIIHSEAPTIVAQEVIDEEVIPGGVFSPDSNMQYPTIDDNPSEQNQEPENYDQDPEDSENIIPEQDLEDSNSEIIEIFNGRKNRG